MAYQSLYRRYRPRRFADMRGQEHVVLALRNAVRENRLGHAHLFSGPRGTGKTTSARILAKVLNCTNVQDGEPCCECDSCKAVEAGTSFDVHELDAASNNGVDSMRDLIEKTMLGTPGRHKVYILDEVHMLSKAAEAALLKTLEEPPPHVIFVLATTDPQKVSETIRSRCQKLAFHLLSADVLTDHVRWIIDDAGLTVSDDAIEAVVRMGGGSARDTLSALEQVVASGGVAPDVEPLDEVIEALIERDTGRAITAVALAMREGRDARTLTDHLIAQLRDCFLSLMAPTLVQLPDRSAERVADQGRRMGLAACVRAMEALGEMLVELRHAPDPRLMLDVTLVRLTNASAETGLAALAARLDRLEAAVAGGGVVLPAASAPAAGGGSAGPTQASGAGGGGTGRSEAAAAARAVADRVAGRAAPAAPPARPAERPAPAATAAPPAQTRPVVSEQIAPRPTTPAEPATRPDAASDRRVVEPMTPRQEAQAAEAAQIAAASPSGTERAKLGTRARPGAADAAPGTPGGPRLTFGSSASAAPPARPTLDDIRAAMPRPDFASGDRGSAAAPASRPAAAAPTAPAGGSGLPGRDELTLKWADHVLPKLKGITRALYAPGRFGDSQNGRATYVLPATTPLAKCEQYRADVEAALAAYFGRPVPLTLSSDAPEPSRRGAARAEDYPPVEDEYYDPSELVDAPPGDAPASGLDRLVKAFPGSEVLEERD